MNNYKQFYRWETWVLLPVEIAFFVSRGLCVDLNEGGLIKFGGKVKTTLKERSMNCKIVSDSSSNIFTVERANYATVPMKIIAGEKEYVDTPQLDLSGMVSYLKKHRVNPDLPAQMCRSGWTSLVTLKMCLL